MRDDEACAVCGRSILAGERTHTYMSPKRGAQLVCELCRGEADGRGWERLTSALIDPEPAVEPAPAEPEAAPELGEEIELGPAEADQRADPAAPGATVGRGLEPEVAESPQLRLERAVACFNASEASRTVAGLMRTLGRPWVSIGAAAGSPRQVRITVAWELSWYQWGVDLDAEPGAIRQLDKGREIGELDGPARQWNATAAPGGVLELGAPISGAAEANGLR